MTDEGATCSCEPGIARAPLRRTIVIRCRTVVGDSLDADRGQQLPNGCNPSRRISSNYSGARPRDQDAVVEVPASAGVGHWRPLSRTDTGAKKGRAWLLWNEKEAEAANGKMSRAVTHYLHHDHYLHHKFCHVNDKFCHVHDNNKKLDALPGVVPRQRGRQESLCQVVPPRINTPPPRVR